MQEMNLSDQELETLIAGGESERVEFKESFGKDKKDFYHDVCAFANDYPNHQKPGLIFVGIKDDGTCANLLIDDELLRNLGALREDGKVLPIPGLSVQKRQVTLSNGQGCEVAVVLVSPAVAPPVRYEGRVCLRVGSRRAYASGQDERVLSERRRAQDLFDDLLPQIRAGLEDLDLQFFREVYLPLAIHAEVLAENERSIEQQLMACHFLTPEQIPTTLGILSLAKNPANFIPGAYVQFVRFRGAEMDIVENQLEIRGRINEIIEELGKTMVSQIQTRSQLGQAREEKKADYPAEALRELLHNAILHRQYLGTNAPVDFYWYDDRVEISSPGGPYGLLTIHNFAAPGLKDYRNPHLAGVLKDFRYIQRFGSGIPRAKRLCEQNGNKLEFTPSEARVLATIWRAP